MRNVADCDEAILSTDEPGDRIYLFGFSRGAYTARCVGGVLSLCGVPTRGQEGGHVPRYGKALRAIADEAVHKVYEHGAGRGKEVHTKERFEQARRFREKYANDKGEANVVPYFIGVFDTVASLGAPLPRRIAMVVGLGIVVSLAAYVAAKILSVVFGFQVAGTALTLLGLGAVGMAVDWLKSHIKWIRDFPNKGDLKVHRTTWRFKFYDENLNPRVQFARHALAIDETRRDFDRVKWASIKDRGQVRPGEPEWLRQVWFAGNHSDIGGKLRPGRIQAVGHRVELDGQQQQEPLHKLQVDFRRLKLFPIPWACSTAK